VSEKDTGMRPSLFIGSSSEGRGLAMHLQQALEDLGVCDVTCWDQGVFAPSGYTIESLESVAQRVDFAVLVATPDDVLTKRGREGATVRDNVIFEFGLFIGALGRSRTYFLSTGGSELHLPSDLQGLTQLPYKERADGNVRAGMNGAILGVEQQVKSLGKLRRDQATAGVPERHILDREIDVLCVSAVAQGWAIKTNSYTTLRLVSPRGKQFTLPKGPAAATREDLRTFVAELRTAGLRVNASIRRPIAESPFSA
jgi:hypothetical protein